MSRCPITAGTGADLSCCRVAGHPTNGPAEHAGCCMHWTPTLRGAPGPHTFWTRAGNGHPFTCERGLSLDGGV